MVDYFRKLSEFKLQFSIFMVLLGIWVIFIFGSPQTFLSFPIYASFMSTVPFAAIMALAMTLVVASAEIDLSFGSVMALGGLVFTTVFTLTGNIYLALLTCLVAGLVAGFLNGLLVVKVGIPSLVATIGTMFFWRGLVIVLSEGLGQTLVSARGTTSFNVLVGRIGGLIPAQMIWAIVIAIILWSILNRHRFGAHVYVVGDNAESARMMGVGVDTVKMFVFAQMGFFAAFAGVLASLEVLYYWPTLGEGYLLPTLAAVFVGGTSVFGGMGTIFGTFIGALITGALAAGIIAMGLTGFWTQLIYGLVIVVSVAVHSVMRRRLPGK